MEPNAVSSWTPKEGGEMKIDQVDGREYWTVTHPDDLLAWNIIYAEDWKDGVKRLHTTNAALPSEFRMLYCSDEILREREQLRFGALVADEVGDILDADEIE